MENKEQQVRKIAQYIRKKYNLAVPITFDNIINDQKCILIEEDMRSLGDGYTDFNCTPPKIVINNQITYIPRKKFTIAHELGHIFISWHDDITICQTDNYMLSKNLLDIQEKEANVFASELLLPEEWVREQLELYAGLELDEMIDVLTTLSDTSIYACFYALENVWESGNVIFVKTIASTYGKRFLAKDTCNTWFRHMDVEDLCEWLAINKDTFNLGSYEITYYKLYKCPTNKEIQDTYLKLEKNIEDTLNYLSGNNILNILHCLKTIINAIDDKYYIAIYDDELFMTLLSENCNLRLEYGISLEEAINYCDKYFDYYEKVLIGCGLTMILVKEPKYQEINDWKNCTVDSKQLLKIILNELYNEDVAKKNLYTINGIIGSANGSNINAGRAELYNILKIRLKSKRGLEKFISHKNFDTFISLRISEIMDRKSK